MTDLTRRKFLIGAPAVAAVAVVGVAVPKAGASEGERIYAYWKSAQTEYIALQPKAPYYVDPSDISGVEPLWNRPILTINRMPQFVNEILC